MSSQRVWTFRGSRTRKLGAAECDVCRLVDGGGTPHRCKWSRRDLATHPAPRQQTRLLLDSSDHVPAPRLDRYGSIFCACQPSMYPYPLGGLFHDLRRSYILSLIDCHAAHKVGVSYQTLRFVELSSLQAHTSLINYDGGRGPSPENRGSPLPHSIIHHSSSHCYRSANAKHT